MGQNRTYSCFCLLCPQRLSCPLFLFVSTMFPLFPFCLPFVFSDLGVSVRSLFLAILFREPFAKKTQRKKSKGSGRGLSLFISHMFTPHREQCCFVLPTCSCVCVGVCVRGGRCSSAVRGRYLLLMLSRCKGSLAKQARRKIAGTLRAFFHSKENLVFLCPRHDITKMTERQGGGERGCCRAEE